MLLNSLESSVFCFLFINLRIKMHKLWHYLYYDRLKPNAALAVQKIGQPFWEHRLFRAIDLKEDVIM
jgi:hypothetical protein